MQQTLTSVSDDGEADFGGFTEEDIATAQSRVNSSLDIDLSRDNLDTWLSFEDDCATSQTLTHADIAAIVRHEPEEVVADEEEELPCAETPIMPAVKVAETLEAAISFFESQPDIGYVQMAQYMSFVNYAKRKSTAIVRKQQKMTDFFVGTANSE